jgi:hypothetical protein
MRDGAANRPTTTRQHHGLPRGCGERTWLRLPSKEFVVERVAWGETARSPSQKLPSAAICCRLSPQNRYACFNRPISFLALEGVPASLGPGLRTVSGAKRSLGRKLPSSADCLMPEASDLRAASGLNLNPARTNPKFICAGFAGSRVALGIGANEAKVHLWRICGHARRARNRRKRSQSPSVADLRARDSQPKSARTNPMSIYAEIAGAHVALGIGTNEAKVHLWRICGHATHGRNRRERSHFRVGSRRQPCAKIKRAERSHFAGRLTTAAAKNAPQSLAAESPISAETEHPVPRDRPINLSA